MFIIFPCVLLIIISISSIWLIYTIDLTLSNNVTIKCIGLQWYWKYEINDVEGLNIVFDSYTLGIDDIILFRMLEVDKKLYVPINTPVKILTTSYDVILSFGVPSLGIKLDAIPHRINCCDLYIFRLSEYIGFCSELCGSSLSNMNIVIRSVDLNTYINWLLANIEYKNINILYRLLSLI